MKSLIVGTAGHIDHGKTALVKALTGIDADRLKEEKRRGITIDLGFAHMDLRTDSGEPLRIGFVDVPGHERFVRNMLAGIGGIDLVLLVIAADEGIKPQTREHLEIVQMLEVKRGFVVLTKSDTVDAETLSVVRLEVDDFMRGTFLDHPESILAVSSLTGAGLQELKRALGAAAAAAQVRDSSALPRLPIDRVFTMKGFGTVVTGTLLAGTIRREQELEVFPGAHRVRVRGVQVHGSIADEAIAGQRTALNLAGATAEDLWRGMTLAAVDTYEATSRVDVKIRMLASAPRGLKNRSRVHFHCYAMETTAEVLLDREGTLDRLTAQARLKEKSKQIDPGQEAFARMRLPAPTLLLPGDRFILRQFSPVVTIGGGVVLDASPIARVNRAAEFLKTLDRASGEEILKARIERRGTDGITLQQLVAEIGWTNVVIERHLAESVKRGNVVRVADRFVHGPAMSELESTVHKKVDEFHGRNTLVGGISREELRERTGANATVFDGVIAAMIHKNKIEQKEDVIRLVGRGVAFKDEELVAKKQIEDRFAAAGLQVPALNDVIASLHIDRVRAQRIVTLLLREKTLIKVSDDLVFHRSALEGLKQKVIGYKMKSSKIDVAAFKDLTGVTRKYAIPLLEYFDRERVTRRMGNAREIL